jgi:hypothetical protein
MQLNFRFQFCLFLNADFITIWVREVTFSIESKKNAILGNFVNKYNFPNPGILFAILSTAKKNYFGKGV